MGSFSLFWDSFTIPTESFPVPFGGGLSNCLAVIGTATASATAVREVQRLVKGCHGGLAHTLLVAFSSWSKLICFFFQTLSCSVLCGSLASKIAMCLETQYSIPKMWQDFFSCCFVSRCPAIYLQNRAVSSVFLAATIVLILIMEKLYFYVTAN